MPQPLKRAPKVLTTEQLTLLNQVRIEIGKPIMTREQADGRWRKIKPEERTATLAILWRYKKDGRITEWTFAK